MPAWAAVALAVACASEPRGAIVTPGGVTSRIEWTAEEQARDIAVRTLRVDNDASHHVVRLAGSEEPHVHDRSDLAVFVLRGSVRMHLGDQVVVLEPGDVVDIPRGTPHWAENIDTGPSEAYVIFAPATDGKDKRRVPR